MTKQLFRCCIIAAGLSIAATHVNAKSPIQFGVKAGVTLQNLDMNRLKLGDYNLATDPDVGFQFGLMSRINLVVLHLQPEININFNSYNLDAKQGFGSDVRSSTIKTTQVEVPVLISKQLFRFLRLNAGPVFNLYSESKYSNSSNEIFKDVRTNKSSVTYAAGVGVDIFSLNLDLRYNGEFRRSRQNLAIDNSHGDFKTRLNFWSFSAGYLF